MSRKEVHRVRVMEQVVLGRLTLIDAIGPLGVSYRHAKRLKRRYASSGVRFLPVGALNKIGENKGSTRWLRPATAGLVMIYRKERSPRMPVASS